MSAANNRQRTQALFTRRTKHIGAGEARDGQQVTVGIRIGSDVCAEELAGLKLVEHSFAMYFQRFPNSQSSSGKKPAGHHYFVTHSSHSSKLLATLSHC